MAAKVLQDDEVDVVSFIDQKFWETGYVATNELISQVLDIPESRIKEMWKKEAFRKALLLRGIDLDSKKSNEVLTPQQVMLANVLFNTHDARSVREKLEMLNVSSQQYHAWLRQPAFSNYLRKRAEEVFKGSDHVAYQSLVASVESGDLSATKLFFEMRGIYNPRVQVDVNIQSIVVRLVEIVASHVSDPVVLERIANDIETLELGASTGPVLNTLPVAINESEANGRVLAASDSGNDGVDSDSASGADNSGADQEQMSHKNSFKVSPKTEVDSKLNTSFRGF